MTRFAHIINPVRAPDRSDLSIAQPVTFQSMRIARDFAAGKADVGLFVAHYAEDQDHAPTDFTATPLLDRSVLDMGSFQIERKLPILKDILDRLYEASDADYLIYTNVDIALVPHFYVAVSRIAEAGCDAFMITRRTIPKHYDGVEDLYFMFSEVGSPHPGNDCFIFRRDAYPKYELGSACIGVRHIARALGVNVVCNATQFVQFTDLHLTFHIGDDRVWMDGRFDDYSEHNRREFDAILRSYHRQGRLVDHPLVRMWVRHNAPDLVASLAPVRAESVGSAGEASVTERVEDAES